MNTISESPCSSSLVRRLEHYLLVARWGVIIAAAAISGFEGFPGGTLVPIVPLWSLFIVLNIFLSLYIWRKEPFFNKKTLPVISLDTIQITLILLLTGGYRSAFYVFTLLFAAEIGLVFSWRTGVSLIVGAGVWLSAVNLLGQTHDLQAYAAYVVITKFVVFLVIGILVAVLNELLRREKTACQEANQATERLKALNALFFQLGESHFDMQRTFKTVVESAFFLPQVRFAVALLPVKEKEDIWEVVASTLDSTLEAERLILPDLPSTAEFALSCTEESCPASLLHWAGEMPQTRLALLPLLTNEDGRPGYLLINYQSDLDKKALSYLQSLAQETNLAIRNARLYTQEAKQIKKMQKFEHLQATFFSAISHELKTPLSVLKILMPSLTQFSNLPKNVQDEVLESVSHNLDRLETLISDLLESTRLEVGSVQLHLHTLSLRQHIEDVFMNINPLAETKSQLLTSKIDLPDLHILADPVRLDQILSNLLLNAVKFSPTQSKIRVEVETGEAEVKICVLDEGPGIPEEERQQIFDKFYVVKEQKALSGVGLGLFICRELVRLHDGRIWVENRPTKGSQFCFSLPHRGQK